MDSQFRFQLGDALARGHELGRLAAGDPWHLPGIDELLAAPVIDRLIAEPEIMRDLRNRATRFNKIKNLAAELRGVAAGQRTSQRPSGSLILQ